ncbi:glucuronyl hydrolase [Maribellus comscasis]|uniref:Glucuronyl hydrolase n=1 Tax=Maribellus comscasis TaxID=2681766 RepID=A0A6I6JI67_9BACT|nr:glycoside hydrolase family 88 protein [Maribellus comscasis]QGY42595.1 glucuronyl hydrolase [Maribellus comscasis]
MNNCKYFLFAILISYSCSSGKEYLSESELISHSGEQLTYALEIAESLRDSVFVSPRTIEDGKLKLVKRRDWTSGFFPGNLWMMYEMTGKDFWKNEALKYTLPLKKEQWNGGTHDMGFKMFCSYGKAWENTNNKEFKDVLIQSAKTLAARFNPMVGSIRSWDHNADKWDFPVIIDNMMNLELLVWAAKESGEEYLKDIAVAHAYTTLKNHFRENNSSYHVVDYNPETGIVQNKHTHQGYAHESSWARGQAWGLYGFTMMYSETDNEDFLEQAQKIAEFLLEQPGIKEGRVPYWDFDAPNIPDEPFDASAAAIMASAFYDLGHLVENGQKYSEVSEKLFFTLSSPDFLVPVGENKGFLLKHSTGHKPHNSEIDVPIVYADYYYLELLKKRSNSLLN